jgi:hypothetical protein
VEPSHALVVSVLGDGAEGGQRGALSAPLLTDRPDTYIIDPRPSV